MNQNTPIVVVLFLCLFGCVVNKTTNTLSIGKWYVETGDRELTWDDFQGTAPQGLRYEHIRATCGWRILPEWSWPANRKDTLRLKVYLRLVMTKNSYVRRLDYPDQARILRHEQGHYDCGRIALRRAQFELDTAVFFQNHFINRLDTILGKYDSIYTQMSKDYDISTHHGRDSASQETWNQFFREELAKYPVVVYPPKESYNWKTDSRFKQASTH